MRAAILSLAAAACAHEPPVPAPAGPPSGAGDAVSAYTGSRLLLGDELAVELMDPNAPDRYNTGVRFTPVAGVIRAVSGGREYLMHRAAHDPLTDVAGLFAEFDLVTPPPGFAEAAVGEPFVKIGVGALVKGAPDYRFYVPHKAVKLADTTATWAKTSAVFTQTLAAVNGYGYNLQAKVNVAGRTLAIEWTLRNTGAKPFETHQYAHNCIAFDNAATRPGTVVAFPFDFTARKLGPEQQQVGREIRFERELANSANIDVDYPAGYAGANALSVFNATTGLRVGCETSIPGSRVALHAASVYVCPEQFVVIRLPPGASRTWTRQYRFH